MVYFIYILFCLVLTAVIALNFLHYMHMFQLGGYHEKPQLNWYKENLKNVLFRQGGAILVPFAVLIMGVNVPSLVFGLILMGVSLYFSLPKKAKKKLVFTHRVLRMIGTCLLIYLILLIIYSSAWYPRWFMLAFFHWLTPFILLGANKINAPLEKYINNRYINDAKRIINSHTGLTVIGITGSYGKTSVKHYLGALLSAKFNVLITPESYNTTMGVVKTVRKSLSGTHEIFVCEMGAKNRGEIKEICDIVKPKHSLITSIGEQHLETFKTINNITRTKFEIVDAVTDGTVFLNYDSEYIRMQDVDKKKITYGINNDNEDKNYFATDIETGEKGTTFTLNGPGGVTAKFETALIGEHNVQNIVAAIAVANFMGISLQDLYLPVKRLESVPHRMQLLGGGDRIVIDDAFNSNPNGAKAALTVLAGFEGIRFLITPGMVELGEREYQLNKELGENAAECCDYAILVGERQAPPIKEGLVEKGFPEYKIYVAKSVEDAMDYVDAVPEKGKKIILLENDLPDNY